MKAAVIRKFGAPLQIETVPVKTPHAGQILVKVIACGVCHPTYMLATATGR